MPWLTVRGRAIHYITGEALPRPGRPAGPLLLFIHGAGHTGAKWRHQVAQLGGRYFVMAVDLPGHGLSAGPAENDGGVVSVAGYGAFVADLWAAIRGRWPEVAAHVVIGHSMGGAAAIEYALSRPADLAGLVLVATGARLRVHPDFLAALGRGEYPLELVAAAFGPGAPPELLRQELEEAGQVAAWVRRQDFLACDAFDRMGEVGEIAVPTAVITGERDRLTPLKFGRYLAEQIPGADMVVIGGAGHMVMLEKPQEVSAAIDRFVAGLPQRRVQPDRNPEDGEVM